jgi:hypothetical protein
MNDFSLTILKIEGLGELSKTQCLIYSNNEIIDRIFTTSAYPQSLKLTTSNLKIVLIDLPSCLPISSVSFNLEIIERPGLHWFPLSLTEEDEINSVPEEVGLPRILLDINPTILTPVIELTESSEANEDFLQNSQFEDFSQLKTKNFELMMKVLDLENEIISQRKTFEEKIDVVEKEGNDKCRSLLEEIEKIRNSQARCAKVSGDFLRENEILKEKLEEMRFEKSDLFEKIGRYERLYEEVKLREDSILKLLEEKDEEIMKLVKKNRTFSISKQISLHFFPFVKEMRTSELFQTCKTPSPDPFRFKTLEILDQKIQASLKQLNLEGFLKLSDEFIYFLGSKKVNVLLKKDLVHVKCGVNTLKTLESFISTSCSQDIQSYLLKKKIKSSLPTQHRRSITISDLDRLPDSIISKTFEQKRLKSSQKHFSKLLPSKQKSSSPLSKPNTSRHV